MEENIIYNYPLIKIEKILNNIRIGNKKTVNLLLKEMLEDIGSNSALSIQDVKYFIVQLVTLVFKDIMEKGVDTQKIFGRDFKLFNEIEQKETMQEITEWIVQLFSKISDYILAVNQLSKDTIIDKVIRYIEQHYSEGTTISEIAE